MISQFAYRYPRLKEHCSSRRVEDYALTKHAVDVLSYNAAEHENACGIGLCSQKRSKLIGLKEKILFENRIISSTTSLRRVMG